MILSSLSCSHKSQESSTTKPTGWRTGNDTACVCGPQEGVIKDLVLLSAVGIRPVLVHGGGPEINSWLEKLGIVAEFKNGLRVTDGKAPSTWTQFELRRA